MFSSGMNVIPLVFCPSFFLLYIYIIQIDCFYKVSEEITYIMLYEYVIGLHNPNLLIKMLETPVYMDF